QVVDIPNNSLASAPAATICGIKYVMQTTKVVMAAMGLITWLFKRYEMTSANVNLPEFLIASATSSKTTRYEANQQMENICPSMPEKAIMPAIPRKAAEAINSPAIASPFCQPFIFLPAA